MLAVNAKSIMHKSSSHNSWCELPGLVSNTMKQPLLGAFSVNQCTVIHSSVFIDKDFSFLILHCIHNIQQYDKYIYQSALSIRKKTLARFQKP